MHCYNTMQYIVVGIFLIIAYIIANQIVKFSGNAFGIIQSQIHS